MEGLDRLGEQRGEIVDALHQLQEHVAAVRFDPNDEASIEAAIRQVNDEVDRRLLPFEGNDIVGEMADQLKASAAETIRRQAADLRNRS
jgi:hypothetical protein